MRTPAARAKPRIAKTAVFPAPKSGWIKNENLASPDARNADGTKISGADILDNWFPTATGCRMRGGSDPHQTVADDAGDITSLLTYTNGNNKSLFAATADSIFDATTETAAAALVTGLSGGAWSWVQFATSGGVFLRAVNGLDTPRIYDGTSWGTSPAITGTGLTPANLSFVWQHQQRLWLVEKDTLNAWYLAAASIGGTATIFPLGAVFTLGGSLLFGSSWSIESGDGLSEQIAFFSSEGEVAVYQGTDPGSADTFSKVGVYRIGKPIGPFAHIRAGGDVVVATDIGLVPLSVAIQRDFSVLSPSAVSFPIEVAWNEAVAGLSGTPWHCEVWPTKQMFVVALPTVSGSSPQWFVSNARTGAWCRYTGWDAKCLALFNNRLFYGSANGRVMEAEVTGADDGMPYTSVSVPLFDPLKSPATVKVSLLGRAVIRSTQTGINPQVSLQKDYMIALPSSPDDTSVSNSDAWGSAKWGTGLWGDVPTKQTMQFWQSMPGAGYALSAAVQITSGAPVAPDVELVETDMTYDMGDIVT